MKRESPNNVKLYHGEGNVYLKFNGNPALIEIKYRGDASIHTGLGRKWGIKYKKGMIIIYPKIDTDLINGQLLFQYRGEFIPNSCRVVGWDLSTKNASLNSDNIHFWKLIDNEWDSIDIKWKGLSNNYKKGSPKHRQNVISGGSS